jgi:hypothetical protein
MHTLGHAGMRADMHTHGHAGAAVAITAVAAPCPEDHCGHDGEMSGWSVCVAVLGGLAVLLLLTVLLLARLSGSARSRTGAATSSRATRAPPWPRQGLRLTSVAVLRI